MCFATTRMVLLQSSLASRCHGLLSGSGSTAQARKLLSWTRLLPFLVQIQRLNVTSASSGTYHPS